MISSISAIRVRLPVIGILALLVCGCGGSATGPEEEVRAWVRKGQEAAEAKDRGELVDMMAPSYTDARGNSRDDIEDLFRFYFLRQQKVALITRIEELDVYDGTAARLVLAVGMAGSDDNVLGFSADAYRFEMELERHDDGWLLMSARWAEFGGDLR